MICSAARWARPRPRAPSCSALRKSWIAAVLSPCATSASAAAARLRCSPKSRTAVLCCWAIAASILPRSFSSMSRNNKNATASIGTITMRTKNSAKRLRKLTCGQRIGGPKGFPHPWMHGNADTLASLGAIAQLGERLDRTQEAGGSSPPSSIDRSPKISARAPTDGATAHRLSWQSSGSSRSQASRLTIGIWAADFLPLGATASSPGSLGVRPEECRLCACYRARGLRV